MAISKNILTRNLSGSLGFLTFRQCNGKTIVSIKSEGSSRPATDNQQKAMHKFKTCAAYARDAIKDKTLKHIYSLAAKKGQSAYNVAFKDASYSPKIKYIDVSDYKGQVRDSIVVKAVDDFKVVRVIVSIRTTRGKLIETGDATLQSNGKDWKYTTTRTIKNRTCCVIKVTAIDLPGNEGRMEQLKIFLERKIKAEGLSCRSQKHPYPNCKHPQNNTCNNIYYQSKIMTILQKVNIFGGECREGSVSSTKACYK